MKNNKKNVLNQIIEKEVIEQEVHIQEISEQEEIDIQTSIDETPENDELLAGLEDDDQPQYPLIDENETLPYEAPEGIIPNINIVDEISEINVKEEIKPRTIESLGKAELRMYQRTGIMPK